MEARPHLRDVTDADLPTFFALQRDEASAWMAAFGTRDADPEAFAARWRKGLGDGTTTARVIVCDGATVGYVATFLYEGKPQVTYWVARTHWGKGIATEALMQLLQQVTARPLYASAARDNAGSLRVLQKCGFVIRGSTRDFAPVRNEEIEEVLLVLE